MKFLCTLPEQKHYKPLTSTTPGKYIWVDKATELVRLVAPIPNPWSTELVVVPSKDRAKNNIDRYPSRLFIRCYEFDISDSEVPLGRIIREIERGKFSYSKNSPAQFFSFPLQENNLTYSTSRGQQWVNYSFYLEE